MPILTLPSAFAVDNKIGQSPAPPNKQSRIDLEDMKGSQQKDPPNAQMPAEEFALATRYASWANTGRDQAKLMSSVTEYPAGGAAKVITQLRLAPSCGVPVWKDFKIISASPAAGHDLIVLSNSQLTRPGPPVMIAVGRVGDYLTVVQYLPASTPVAADRIRELGALGIKRLVSQLPDPTGPFDPANAPKFPPPSLSSNKAPGLLTSADVGSGWNNDPTGITDFKGELSDYCQKPIDNRAAVGMATMLFRRVDASKQEIVSEFAYTYRDEAAAVAAFAKLRKSTTECNVTTVPANFGGDESLLIGAEGQGSQAVVRVGAKIAMVDLLGGQGLNEFPGGRSVVDRIVTKAGERL